MKSFRGLLMLAISATLSGCLEPHYVRPQAPVSAAWPDANDDVSAAGARTASDIGWREFFTDPKLQALIAIALVHNPDARIAALNIAAARAQYKIQHAELFPTISASAVEQVEKYPDGVAAPSSSGAATGSTAVSAGSGITRYFNVGVGFTAYEIDIFGRIRSLSHARLEQYLGYVETRRSTQLSIVAEVASAYVTWLADQELLKITQDTLHSQQDSLGLIQMSYDGGVGTGLELNQAKTTVASAQANLAQYTRQVAQDVNALVVLLGTPLPENLPQGSGLDEQQLLAALPAGLPSTILTQRPDVLAAEHNLIAANASIGAARAAFFPRVTLTGNYGTASTALSGLFEHGSTAWTFSPQISVPIFAGGANVAALNLAEIQKNTYIVQYEQVIQTSFREVADALVGRGTLDAQIAADQTLLDASSESFRLSTMRFDNGVDSYLTVLDSQRSLYGAQQSLINVKLARLQNLVTLYKALGGGWRENAPAAPDTNARGP